MKKVQNDVMLEMKINQGGGVITLLTFVGGGGGGHFVLYLSFGLGWLYIKRYNLLAA